MLHARHTVLPYAQDRVVEWLSAAIMIGWALILAWPGQTLDTPIFAGFHRLGMTEEAWTAVFATIGVGRLVALYINGRWARTPLVRMAGAAFGVITWMQIASLFVEGSVALHGPPSTALAVYPALAFADLYSLWRASADARYLGQ